MVANFQVEYLGIEYFDYFPGYGSEGYDFCTYGIGDTEAEALDDCLESMAQAAGFNFTDEDEKRIRADYGAVDEDTLVPDCLNFEENQDYQDLPCFMLA